MPWIERPDRGWLAGTVAATTAGENDSVEVTIVRRRYWPFGNTTRVRTDGNGYFGVARLQPGRYEVSVGSAERRQRFELDVQSGRISRVFFAPPGSASR
jgi:hypothetical protein